MKLNSITSEVISAALKVHSGIGPGVLESVYQRCLQHELIKAGISVRSEMFLPVHYDGLEMDSGYRIDLLVENQVIVELKSVETVLPLHKIQLLTYLRLANMPVGLLLNFNVVRLRDGINRVLNNRYRG